MIIEPVDIKFETALINQALDFNLEIDKEESTEKSGNEFLSKVPTLILQGDLSNAVLFINFLIEIKFPLNRINNICYTICYSDQCNFEIDTRHLQVLSKLDVPIGISCFSYSD